MMKKDKLVQCLRNGLAEEEQALPLYQGLIAADWTGAGFSKEDEARNKRLLADLQRDASSNAETFRELIRKVEGAGQDDF